MIDVEESSGAEAQTEKHWSNQARKSQLRAELSWLGSRIVNERHINPAISGQAGVGWLEWVMSNFVPMAATTACALGCGDGGLERHARFLGFQATFDSFDISSGAIKTAREEAVRHGYTGIRYRQADLNEIRLLPKGCDVAFASMSLHHILHLEELFEVIHDALIPGGLLIFNEFVGPRKFQWTDLQLLIVNQLLAALPPRLREDQSTPGELKAEVLRPTIEEMDAIDPSEAALSDQIIPLAHRFFEPVAVRSYGGTLLALLLERIMSNFREDSEEDAGILLDIFQLESLLMKTGVLASDFALGVFKKA